MVPALQRAVSRSRSRVMVALTVVHTVTGALVLAVTLVTALISYRMLRAGAAVADSAPASEQVAH